MVGMHMGKMEGGDLWSERDLFPRILVLTSLSLSVKCPGFVPVSEMPWSQQARADPPSSWMVDGTCKQVQVYETPCSY